MTPRLPVAAAPPAPAILSGELIPPGDASVSVVCKPHPFKLETQTMTMPAGHTLAEIIERSGLTRRYVHAHVGDWRAPRELWHAIRPKPGMRVTLVAVPQGGGGSTDILRMVLFIAVAALAFAVPYAAPALFPGIGSLGIGAIQAGVTPCGRIIVNQLHPPKRA